VLSNVAMSAPPDRKKAGARSSASPKELFLRRPEGSTAPVDERGANFSAGERQLPPCAAVYRDSPCSISTRRPRASTRTEAHLQVALEAVMEGRTAIVIAHSPVDDPRGRSHRRLHKGRVVEMGTHEALLEKDGVYPGCTAYNSRKSASPSPRWRPAKKPGNAPIV